MPLAGRWEATHAVRHRHWLHPLQVPNPRCQALHSGLPGGAETAMTTTDIPALDQAKLEAFGGQAVVDMGAAISGLLLHLGDRRGLYKGRAGAGPITSPTLANRTRPTERYVREWLGNQAVCGYVVYDPADGPYEPPPEQAMVVA